MRATKNNRTGRYQFRFRDSAGNQQQFSSKKDFPAGLTQRQADLIATDIFQTHEEVITGLARPFLSDCVERMLKHLENNGAKGVKNYRSHANMALQWDNNNTIDEVVKVCLKMRDDMLDAKKPDGSPKYSTNTIYQRMYIYKRTANLAYEEWDVLKYPLGSKMKSPKKPRARQRFLSIDEFIRLIEACEEDQTKHIIILLALTGIRHAELVRMESGDILKNKITIDGKNGRIRSFAISDMAMQVASKINFPVETDYDKKYRPFVKAKKKAGIEDFNMHDLRHTFASWLAQSGDVSLHLIQQVMGHSQMEQTLNYAHLMPENLDNVAINLDKNFKGLLN